MFGFRIFSFSIKASLVLLIFTTICHQAAFSQDVLLRSQADIDAFDPNITTIEGDLTIGSSYEISQDVVDLSNLSNIDSIKGVLTISRNDNLTSIDGLESLSYVWQNIRILDNKSLKNIDGLSLISKVNVQLLIWDNAALENLNGLLSIDTIASLSLENNDALIDLNGLQSVKYIESALVISAHSKLENIDALSSLTYVGENINIRLNESLQNIDGLSNLEYIGTDIRISTNAALANLNGLSSIHTVNGNFDALANHSLPNLRGLHSIDSIHGFLRINNCDMLSNIDDLFNLKYVGDYLQLSSHEILSDLNGLASVNYIGGQMSFNSNPLLTNLCGIQHLLFNPDLVVGGIINYEALLNLYSTFQFTHYNCLESHVGGNVYYDLNQNKLRDSTEFGVPNININLNDDGFMRLTNNDGRYDALVQPGQPYSVEIELEENWEITTDSMNYNFVFDLEDEANRTRDFGVIHNQPFSSAKINLTSEATRCNSEVEFYLHAVNDGFNVNSGQIVLHLAPGVAYISSSPEMTVDGQTLVYTIDTLNPFQALDFTLNLEMPSEQQTGEILDFSAEIYLENEAGQLEVYDAFQYQSTVLCSYDPNDKQVSPPGVKDENYTLIDDLLSYTIRFQNTGNAPAINILIIDTLDEGLDIETFNVVNSSFPLLTTVRDRVVSFQLNNIFLIDSLTNEPESHGFINYTIKVNDDIEELDVIENTAHIIFDSNPAIVTNTTKNTMVEFICDDVNNFLDVSICEGQEFEGFEESGVYVMEYDIGITCDSFVILDLTVIDTSFRTIDTIVCPDIGYLGFTEEGEYLIDTLNNETGCMEQWLLNLTFYEETDPLCLVGVQAYDENEISIYPNPTTGEINIEGLSVKSIRVLNAYGSLMVEADGNRLDIMHLNDGVYFLEVWDGVRNRVFKIVKH